MSPARENHGLEGRITDLFSMLYEAGNKLSAVASTLEAFRERIAELEAWQAAYPDKLQAMLRDADAEHRRLGEGITRMDGEIKLLASQVIDVRAEVVQVEEALEGTEPKIQELEAKIAKLRTRPPPPQWKSTGIAIAGLLTGLAAVVGVLAGMVPVLQWVIVAVLGP